MSYFTWVVQTIQKLEVYGFTALLEISELE